MTVGEDGASHQAIEDIALMRSVPNMVVISPVMLLKQKQLLKQLQSNQGPCYVRLGRRSAVPTINTSDDYKFEIGKAVTLREGKDVTIIATGNNGRCCY